MEELKLEDLQVGDELEFKDEMAKRDFILNTSVNSSLTDNCLEKGFGEVKTIGEGGFTFKKKSEDSLSYVYEEEVKYFKKVSKPSQQFVDVKVEVGESTTPPKYKNAQIKSYEEAYTRMMAGEIFYLNGYRVWYNAEHGNFMFEDKLIGSYKSEFGDFTVKQEWYDTVSEDNPVLCKVWDIDESYCCYVKVVLFEEGLYFCQNDNQWINAEPVKPEECYGYEG